MLEELLRLNASAAAEGNYEAAYHLLMAALHCADHRSDLASLDRLVKIAQQQAAELEAIRPPHHLSRTQANARRQTALFDSFLAHVEAVRLRISSMRQLRKHHPAG